MKRVSDMFFKYKEYQLYYEIYGEGQPLLILHGWYLDHRSLYSLVEKLENKDNYQRIYLDIVGMGLSSTPNHILTNDEVVVILEAFIKELINKQIFSILAYSNGGYLSLGIAYDFYKQINNMILLAPVVIPNHSKRIVEKRNVKLLDIENDIHNQTLQQYLKVGSLISKNSFQLYQKDILPALILGDKNYLIPFHDKQKAFINKNDLFNRIKNINMLFILGKHDNVVGYQDHLHLKSILNNTNFIVLDNVGHYLFIEEQDKIIKIIQEYLNNNK
ncbi:MAG: alpha/beta hydrolase [Bacilli bacterium]|jgi:pimeloyl-ACP methyl ester carboxylesterase|nr:alpha/beta hydrolase [Bacilli bacterium]